MAGAKLANLGHEMVCSYIHQVSWKFFNISMPFDSYKYAGFLCIALHPRRAIILQRHITKGFRNLDEVVKKLRQVAKQHSFDLEVNTTESLVFF